MNILPKLAVAAARLLGSRNATLICKMAYPWYSFAKHGERHWFNRIAVQNNTWCNRTCYYCPYGCGNEAPMQFMSDETFAIVVDRIAELEWSEPVAFGIFGEPLFDKRLPDLIAKLKARVPRCYPVVYSNGDYAAPSLVEKLINAGLWRIGFTKHPPSNDAWDIKINALRNRFPEHVGLQVIPESHMSNHGGTVPGMEPMDGQPCHAPECFPIRHTGDVVLCCSDFHCTTNFGNVRDKSITEIWRGYSTLRADLRKGVRRLKMCKSCRAMC